MHIAFVTGNYPTPARPTAGTFVQQFVWAMARQGNACIVINPASMFDRRYGALPPRRTAEDAGGGATVEVKCPRCVTFSSRNLGWTHTGRWTQHAMNIVTSRVIRALSPAPDLVYGHFLYHAGRAAAVSGNMLGVPAVVGVGEDHLWTVEACGIRSARVHWANDGYFLANSMPNRDALVDSLHIDEARILVQPNGVDLGRMYPRDRTAMKRKFGIGAGTFVVAFLGANEERKGPDRVVAAVEGIPDTTCLLVGLGTQTIDSGCVAWAGPVTHDLVPEILSCADAFALPTTSEGSCNAVIEAMACGLPIVTSNGRYMDDIVDDEVAIRVDPMDVRAIRDAILTLKNDPVRRKRMSEACLRKARHFDINERAKRVTNWMKELVREYQR